MTILLSEEGARYTGAAEREGADLWLTRSDLDFLLGWTLGEAGLCRADSCVPLAADLHQQICRGGRVNVSRLWQELDWPLECCPRTDTWVFSNGLPLATPAGVEAPDFSLPDVAGRLLRLSTFRGRKVLLIAWASWCPSRADLQAWQRLQKAYPELAVIAVALDSRGAEAVRPWVEQASGLRCAVDVEHRTAMSHRLCNVPTAVWIDEAGRIVRPAEPAGAGDEVLAADDAGALPAAEARALAATRDTYMDKVRDWLQRGANSAHAMSPDAVLAQLQPVSRQVADAHACFRLGRYLFVQNHRREGLAFLARAAGLAPGCWTFWRQMRDLEQSGVHAVELRERVERLGLPFLSSGWR